MSPAMLHPCVPSKDCSKHVRFTNIDSSIPIPATSTEQLSINPQKARGHTCSYYRRATPHRKKSRCGVSYPKSPGGCVTQQTDDDKNRMKPRLIESGAVRVQIATHTNPRRGTNLLGSQRLIDQGAIRMNITRHTTPRRLVAARSRIWSPPPTSSCRKKKVTQSEKKAPNNNGMMLPSANANASFTQANTPAKKKDRTLTKQSGSNARRGGHRFRASLSPKPPSTKKLLHSTPIDMNNDVRKENLDNTCLDASELHRRLIEHSEQIENKCVDAEEEEHLSRTLF